ncbi:HEAT repeat domain-containing protein [Actinomycetes bacterium KLBMP 9759]
MFDGLDEIDWASMTHAYGPASEIPDLVRGLVSTDPAVREMALDDFYAAVHHQGDVYACTIAAIPFLTEAATRPDLPGRGPILELLASIGESGAARPVIAEMSPGLVTLLADADPAVRRAAPKALRLRGPEVITALRERFPDETDHEARTAIISAVSGFGGADAWISEVVATGPDPATRLAALAELASGSPTTEVVSTAVPLLREVYATEAPQHEPAGFATDTLIGQIRERSDQQSAGRAAPRAAHLVRSLSMALDDRVDERIALLTHLLDEPSWEARHDAIRPASALIRTWRGDFHDLVRLIGAQLVDPNPRLPAVAAEALVGLGEVTSPAADALTRSLDTAPREATHPQIDGPPSWILHFDDGTSIIGPLPRALAGLRDLRVLPAVEWMLERPHVPGGVDSVVGRFGSAAAHVVPLIRRHLRDHRAVDGATAEHTRRRSELVNTLGRIGPAAADAVPELLAQAQQLPWQVLTALGLIGPAASDAIPTVRDLLLHAEPRIVITAAVGLWRITHDPALTLPVLAEHLHGNDYDAPLAAEGLAELGPMAAETAPELRELLHAGSPWTRLRAAQALWRTVGQTEVSVLTGVYAENEHTRLHVAQCLAEMGPAAADAAPQMRAELDRRERGNRSIDDDAALLTACHAVVAAATP